MQIPLNDIQLSFAQPLALALPLLAVLAFLFKKNTRQDSIPFPSLRAFQSIPISLRQSLRQPVLKSLALISIICIGIAAARPQILIKNDPQSYARSLMLAIDLSKSMSTEDISTPKGVVSRLEAVKAAAKDFIKARPADRIGLILFGTDVYLKSPLTLQHDALLNAIDELSLGSAGSLTSIGDAIAQSLKRMSGIPAAARSVVVFTDGMNTSGDVDPLNSASMAQKLATRVYTVGIGSSTQRTNSYDPAEQKSVEFDEYTLKQIAALSGAIYSNASSSFELEEIQKRIEASEKYLITAPLKPVLHELFLPLAIAAALSFSLMLVLSESYFRKLP